MSVQRTSVERMPVEHVPLDLIGGYACALQAQHYVLMRDVDMIGERRSLLRPLFEELESDHPGVHEDRDRARDVLRFAFDASGEPVLAAAEAVTLVGASDNFGPREHKRLWLRDNDVIRRFATSILAVIGLRQLPPAGRISFDLFRTRRVVTHSRHRDGETYVGIYCVERHCEGAVTELSLDQAGTQIVFRRELQPGAFLLFRDDQFFHHTTEITTAPELRPYRHAIVVTVS